MSTEGYQISRKAAVKFVVLLGLVSLFADITYEGARGIAGPFLAVLGASGTAVGVVAGLGEFIGYGLRLVSGYVSDRTRRYWLLTIIGYAVNLLAVPLLALAGRWEVAAVLLVLERMGKAVRTPSRDAMLSHATSAVGRGWGFGLHEAMDQIGAMTGPLIVALVLYLQGGYRTAFAVLLAPAVLALLVLLTARFLYPRPHDLEIKTSGLETKGFDRSFWLYLGAVALIAAGYADFPLISFHFQKQALVSGSLIPIYYAVAMGVDALAALLWGRLFDRQGVSALALAVLLSAGFAPLAFLGGSATAVLLGMVLWGVGMGAQESVMRAVVAEMVPPERRGTAYGLFNSGFGLCWFLGSALMGVLYDFSLPLLVAFSVTAQVAAMLLLLSLRGKLALSR